MPFKNIAADREAEGLRDVFEERYAKGDFDHFIPKKYQGKPRTNPQAGPRNPRDEIRFRGQPARMLAEISLHEVRRHNPDLAIDIDRAGGVSVVSVDDGAGTKATAIRLLTGELVPIEELGGGADYLEPAFGVSEEFHGRQPRFVESREDELTYSPVLADLGLLVELGVYSETSGGKPAETPLVFSANEGIRLASNPEKNQMFIVGAVQLDRRTLERLGVDPREMDKEIVAIGPVVNVVYRTAKKMHHLRTADYVHEMAEEGGVMPQLLWDRLNGELSLAGGTYTITERGIVN